MVRKRRVVDLDVVSLDVVSPDVVDPGVLTVPARGPDAAFAGGRGRRPRDHPSRTAIRHTIRKRHRSTSRMTRPPLPAGPGLGRVVTRRPGHDDAPTPWPLGRERHGFPEGAPTTEARIEQR
jgi:hypothetical protein